MNSYDRVLYIGNFDESCYAISLLDTLDAKTINDSSWQPSFFFWRECTRAPSNRGESRVKFRTAHTHHLNVTQSYVIRANFRSLRSAQFRCDWLHRNQYDLTQTGLHLSRFLKFMRTIKSADQTSGRSMGMPSSPSRWRWRYLFSQLTCRQTTIIEPPPPRRARLWRSTSLIDDRSRPDWVQPRRRSSGDLWNRLAQVTTQIDHRKGNLQFA